MPRKEGEILELKTSILPLKGRAPIADRIHREAPAQQSLARQPPASSADLSCRLWGAHRRTALPGDPHSPAHAAAICSTQSKLEQLELIQIQENYLHMGNFVTRLRAIFKIAQLSDTFQGMSYNQEGIINKRTSVTDPQGCLILCSVQSELPRSCARCTLGCMTFP